MHLPRLPSGNASSFGFIVNLEPWLFKIAHNRCIDFLHRREVRQQAEAAAVEPDTIDPSEPIGPGLGRAVEHLVLALPPKERACVLLKDVFDYSLEEIARLVDSTVRRQGRAQPRPVKIGVVASAINAESRGANPGCLLFSAYTWSDSIGRTGMDFLN